MGWILLCIWWFVFGIALIEWDPEFLERYTKHDGFCLAVCGPIMWLILLGLASLILIDKGFRRNKPVVLKHSIYRNEF